MRYTLSELEPGEFERLVVEMQLIKALNPDYDYLLKDCKDKHKISQTIGIKVYFTAFPTHKPNNYQRYSQVKRNDT